MLYGSRRIVAVSFALAAVLSASDVDAQFFRWMDSYGNVHYTDRPQQPSDGREPAAPAAPAPAVRPPSPAPPRVGGDGLGAARPAAGATVKRAAPPPPTITATPVGPADAERRRATMINEIFRLLGLPMLMSAALPEGADTQPHGGADATKFRGTYLPLARRSFRPYFVDQHAEAGLAWLRSPLGRALNKALGADVANADVDSYAARPDAVSAERRRLLSRLGRASQSTEIAVTPVSVLVVMLQFMMMEILPQAFEAATPQSSDPQAALLTGLTSGLGAAIREGMKQHTTREALRSAVDEIVDQAGREGQNEVQKQLAYRLREVGNDDLTRAIQFFEGGGGQWLGTAVRLASRDAAVTMVEDALKEMRTSVTRK